MSNPAATSVEMKTISPSSSSTSTSSSSSTFSFTMDNAPFTMGSSTSYHHDEGTSDFEVGVGFKTKRLSSIRDEVAKIVPCYLCTKSKVFQVHHGDTDRENEHDDDDYSYRYSVKKKKATSSSSSASFPITQRLQDIPASEAKCECCYCQGCDHSECKIGPLSFQTIWQDQKSNPYILADRYGPFGHPECKRINDTYSYQQNRIEQDHYIHCELDEPQFKFLMYDHLNQLKHTKQLQHLELEIHILRRRIAALEDELMKKVDEELKNVDCEKLHALKTSLHHREMEAQEVNACAMKSTYDGNSTMHDLGFGFSFRQDQTKESSDGNGSGNLGDDDDGEDNLGGDDDDLDFSEYNDIHDIIGDYIIRDNDDDNDDDGDGGDGGDEHDEEGIFSVTPFRVDSLASMKNDP